MSNKNLLLPNYYVQSSINCIINVTESIHLEPSIAKQLSMCLVYGSSGVQNPGPSIMKGFEEQISEKLSRFICI